MRGTVTDAMITGGSAVLAVDAAPDIASCRDLDRKDRALIEVGFRLGEPPTDALDERLSDRELHVFRLIGKGLTSGAIATELIISTHTVDSHRENIKRKLGLGNAAELSRVAVQWALENG